MIYSFSSPKGERERERERERCDIIYDYILGKHFNVLLSHNGRRSNFSISTRDHLSYIQIQPISIIPQIKISFTLEHAI